MSLEMILLIAAFVVWPLVQQLIGAERLRQEQRQKQGQNPVQAGGRPPAAPLPMPELPPAPVVDEGIWAQTVAEPAVRLTKRILRHSGAASRRKAPQDNLAVGLRDRRNLRRAVILTTVIGPCRAASPYGSSEGGGH